MQCFAQNRLRIQTLALLRKQKSGSASRASSWPPTKIPWRHLTKWNEPPNTFKHKDNAYCRPSLINLLKTLKLGVNLKDREQKTSKKMKTHTQVWGEGLGQGTLGWWIQTLSVPPREQPVQSWALTQAVSLFFAIPTYFISRGTLMCGRLTLRSYYD